MAKVVNFGIDLGTTNSAIARMTSKGAEVIPVKRLNYIPSAVVINERGELKVGVEALQYENVECARWFKRLMGTSNSLSIGKGNPWTPQELSAEVLKALKAAAKLKTNEDIVDVVITVPAMFSQPQCSATSEAAMLAGLNAVTLLQEPIAAATAYLSDEPIPGTYLVYDLGGGTFDVSLIRLKDGEMSVIGHGGDNYLGGADLDRAIYDWVIEQARRKGGDTAQFTTTRGRHKLLMACEEARIALSDSNSTAIFLDMFDLPFEKLELSRELLDDLVSDLITKTLEIAQTRLTVAGLKGSDIKSILLVGGPTQMPYVRQRLADTLGIPLNLDQDPMTVVAKGAAIHAGTLLRHDKSTRAATNSLEANVELFYDPVTPEDKTTVAGKITSPAEFQGEIRLNRAEGNWETGWIKLTNCAFSAEAVLGRNQVTEFQIALRDSQGSPVPTSPKSFSISSGVRAAPVITPYDYSVVIDGSDLVKKLLSAGETLPASGFLEFKIAQTIIAGGPDEKFIYFMEGTSPFAADNVKVGTLSIKGVDISRTLKEGERVEIRIWVDENRQVKGTVYIPLIDQEYDPIFKSALEKQSVTDLNKALAETQEALKKVESLVSEDEQDQLLQAGREVERLEATIERVENGEVGESERVHKQLKDTQASVRPLIEKYKLVALHGRIFRLADRAETLCNQFRDPMGLAKVADIRSDADRALRLELERDLETCLEKILEVFWSHYGKTAECWEYHVDLMRDHGSVVSGANGLAHYELVQRAESALASERYEEVRLLYFKSSEMLPDDEKPNDRFSDVAIR